MSAKKYSCREALAAIATMPADKADDKSAIMLLLASTTDIPQDRLEACYAEVVLIIPMARNLVALTAIMIERQPKPEDMFEAFGAFDWIDDDKGTVDLRATLKSEDGEIVSKHEAHFKLQA